MENKEKFQEELARLLKMPIKRFYASAVASKAGVTVLEAEAELIQMAKSGESVKIVYQLICPSCARTIAEKYAPSDFPEDAECLCGEDIEEIGERDLSVAFEPIRLK